MATMSPLRQLVIEDMTVCNLSPATQQSYVYAVARFSRHFGVPPARLGPEDVRAYQLVQAMMDGHRPKVWLSDGLAGAASRVNSESGCGSGERLLRASN